MSFSVAISPLPRSFGSMTWNSLPVLRNLGNCHPHWDGTRAGAISLLEGFWPRLSSQSHDQGGPITTKEKYRSDLCPLSSPVATRIIELPRYTTIALSLVSPGFPAETAEGIRPSVLINLCDRYSRQ